MLAGIILGAVTVFIIEREMIRAAAFAGAGALNKDSCRPPLTHPTWVNWGLV